MTTPEPGCPFAHPSPSASHESRRRAALQREPRRGGDGTQAANRQVDPSPLGVYPRVVEDRGPAYVYAIKNRRTGQCYVGSTRERKARWKKHMDLLESGLHTSKLQEAWDASAPDDWDWLVLESGIPVLHQFESEQFWIDRLDAFRSGLNSAPRAGSFVSIDSRGYSSLIQEREADVLAMLELLKKRVPYREVAARYGVSLGFLSKLKKSNAELFADEEHARAERRAERKRERARTLERKRDARARNHRIQTLREAGWTYRAIAEELDCALGTVANVLAKEGAERP